MLVWVGASGGHGYSLDLAIGLGGGGAGDTRERARCWRGVPGTWCCMYSSLRARAVAGKCILNAAPAAWRRCEWKLSSFGWPPVTHAMEALEVSFSGPWTPRVSTPPAPGLGAAACSVSSPRRLQCATPSMSDASACAQGHLRRSFTKCRLPSRPALPVLSDTRVRRRLLHSSPGCCLLVTRFTPPQSHL